MYFKRIISVILSATLVFMCLTGCEKSEETFSLYIEVDEKVNTLDPQLCSGTAEEMLVKNLFEGLVRFDKDGNIVPGAAESIETSDDGLNYTFKIRKNAVWSDGTKVTADDFVFAFERALDPKTKAPKAALLYSIKNAKEVNMGQTAKPGVFAEDENTLKIELAEKNTEFLKNLTSSVAMPCNRAAFKRFKGKYGMNDEDFISNGSFYLNNWQNDGELSLKIIADKNYKGSFTANPSSVIFSLGDKKERTEKLNKNSVDLGFVNYTTSNDKIEVKNFSKTCYVLGINKNSDYGKSEFKKAITASINVDDINEKLEYGLESADNILPGVILKNNKSLNKLIKTESKTVYNKETAKQNYLKGVKEYGIPENASIIYTGDEKVKSAVLSLAESLQKTLGIVVNIENIKSESELKSRIFDGDYTLSVTPLSAQSNSPTQFLSQFESENSYNIYKFSNNRYDNIISGLKDSLSESEFVTATQNMLNIVAESLLITPLFYEIESFGYSNIYSMPEISAFDGVIDLAMVKKLK